MTIVKGKIGNALTSTASDHVVVVANDIYDETQQKYQSEINAEKGSPNGVATLDNTGKIPSSQLPSYVDDIIEVVSYDNLPAEGESGKIYVTLDTNLTYRWGGSDYVEVSKSLAIGETATTAFAGSRGVALEQGKVDKEIGKGLTATDVTYNEGSYAGLGTSYSINITNKSTGHTENIPIGFEFGSSEKNKLNNIESRAQVNVIEHIKVNNTSVSPISKTVSLTIPQLSVDNETLIITTTFPVNNDDDEEEFEWIPA